jgi:hypothetical protein
MESHSSKNINDSDSANRSKRVNQDEAQRRGSLWRSAAGRFFARDYLVQIAPGSARHWPEIEETSFAAMAKTKTELREWSEP